MKIYICIAKSLLTNRQPNITDLLKDDLSNSLQKFYGRVNIETYAMQNGECIVYVMGSPKYPNLEDKIKNQIVHSLNQRFPSLNDRNIDIKLNYAAFNPNFHPVKDQSHQKTPETKKEKKSSKSGSDEYDYDKLSLNYTAETPLYSFDQVILPDKTRTQIEEAVGIIEVEEKVFDEWGLRSIIPYATSALSFYGPPGTGKSMAAQAVAHKMGKKILSATYADIESKFHGEGPKMVKAIFKAAEREDAVLFLDESDSLLSKRLTNVSDGSAQAINSMRSQLLISLEQFKGVVIFATNLVVNYDQAFLSRLINIEFAMPDRQQRKEIWEKHLRGDAIRIPLGYDVNLDELAEKYEFCGREIKNAVKNACVSVALSKRDLVTQNDFLKACEITKEESQKAIAAKDYTNSQIKKLDPKQSEVLKNALQNKITSGEIAQTSF